MSDWLLQGVDPREPAGNEFYLHTTDEWFDIVAVVDHALRPLFPLEGRQPTGMARGPRLPATRRPPATYFLDQWHRGRVSAQTTADFRPDA